MKKTLRSLALMAITCSSTTPTWAGQFLTPAWAGGELSVDATWEAGLVSLSPGDMGVAPSGFAKADDSDPSTVFYTDPGIFPPPVGPEDPPFPFVPGGEAFIDFISSGDPGPDDLRIFIPNWVDDLPTKLVHIEIFWELSAPVSIVPPGVTFTMFEDAVGTPEFSAGPAVFESHFEVEDAGGPGVSATIFDLVFEPNPDWEVIHIAIDDAIELGDIYVNTISVPEPSTSGLLLGALSLGWIMVRRRQLAG